MAGAAKTGRQRQAIGFYQESLTEAEKWERARQIEGLDEEVALLRVRLKEALEERPQDMQLIAKGVDLLVKAVAARYRLSRKAQSETITGDWRFDGQLGIQSAPDSLISLRVEPSNKAWMSGPVHLIKVGAQSAIMNANASVYAIGGMATISAGGGYTLPDLAGLFFTAASSGTGNITNMYGVYVRHALVGFSGSLSTLRGLHVHTPMYIGSTSPTRSWGLNVTNQGRAGITDTFGLMIHDQSGSVNNYLIWAGANESGTPNLRLDAGTPATDKSNLILNFGGTLLRLIKDANGFVKAEAL